MSNPKQTKRTTTLAAISRRLIRSVLNRNNLSLIILFLWWPACMVHTFWNNRPPHRVHWWLTEVKKSDGTLKMQDEQYYIFDTGNMVAFSLILLSFILNKTKTRQYKMALIVSFIISLSDIIHYWYNFKQSEWIVTIQGLTMVALALWIIITTTKWTKV